MQENSSQQSERVDDGVSGLCQRNPAPNAAPPMAATSPTFRLEAALSDQPAPEWQEAVACIDPRHLQLLRKDWRQGNCLKHADDAVAGDVMLYSHPAAPAPVGVPDGWTVTAEKNPLGGKQAMRLRAPDGRTSLFGTFSEEIVARDFLADMLAAATSAPQGD